MQAIGELLAQWYYLYADAVKNAASVAAGIISVFAALLRLRRDRKLLCYSWQWLCSGDLEDDVYTLYWRLRREYPSHRIRALRVRLRNAGQQAIRRDDFDGGAPIEIYFDPKGQVSGVIEFAAAYECLPRNLKPEVHRKDEHTVSIQPLLLNGGPFLNNGGDEFDVMILLRSEKRKVNWFRRAERALKWLLEWSLVFFNGVATVNPTPFRVYARIAGISWPMRDSLPMVRAVLRSGVQDDLARQFRLVVTSSAIYITVRLLFVLLFPSSGALFLNPPMSLLLQVMRWTELAAFFVGFLAIWVTVSLVLERLFQAARSGTYRWLRNVKDWWKHLHTLEQ